MTQSKKVFSNFNNKPWAVWLLLGIQITVYLGMTIVGLQRGFGFDGSTSGQILVEFGALQKELVFVNHEYWRFITPIFVHIGLMHLVVNSLTLYFIGVQLEALLGHWRFILVYLVSGITGNIASFAFGNPLAISAGASTSLFGLLGMFVALGRVYRHHPMIQFMSQRMMTFIIMNLVFNLMSPSIDILGHVGGAVGGFLLGFIISVPSVKGSRYDLDEHDVHRKIRSGIIFVFLVGLSLFFAYRKFSNN